MPSHSTEFRVSRSNWDSYGWFRIRQLHVTNAEFSIIQEQAYMTPSWKPYFIHNSGCKYLVTVMLIFTLTLTHRCHTLWHETVEPPTCFCVLHSLFYLNIGALTLFRNSHESFFCVFTFPIIL